MSQGWNLGKTYLSVTKRSGRWWWELHWNDDQLLFINGYAKSECEAIKIGLKQIPVVTNMAKGRE